MKFHENFARKFPSWVKYTKIVNERSIFIIGHSGHIKWLFRLLHISTRKLLSLQKKHHSAHKLPIASGIVSVVHRHGHYFHIENSQYGWRYIIWSWTWYGERVISILPSYMTHFSFNEKRCINNIIFKWDDGFIWKNVTLICIRCLDGLWIKRRCWNEQRKNRESK